MRLWRVRRRHDHIDAVLSQEASAWTLEYLRNDTPFLAWRYPDRPSAVADADERLKDLLRAGWTSHW
jgi:hypothetical protein